MGILSTQIVASWVKASLNNTEWQLLRSVAVECAVKQTKRSEDEVADFVDEKLYFIAEHLRDERAEYAVDGRVSDFEIDNDLDPYIRLTVIRDRAVLNKLRSIDPFLFERVCAKVLEALGGSAKETQRTNDGGVDFVALKLKVVPSNLPMPHTCYGVVLGQAKRYKEGSNIGEVRIREFVGGGLLQRHLLGKNSDISPLAPTLYAYWTTSDLDPNARKFARSIGLWYMDGSTFASYIEELGLRDFVMALESTAEIIESQPPISLS